MKFAEKICYDKNIYQRDGMYKSLVNEFKNLINNINKTAPILKEILNNLTVNLEQYDDFIITSYYASSDDYSPSYWNEEENIISINIYSSNIDIVSNLILQLCDVINSKYKPISCANFNDGECYSNARIKAQYLSFKNGYKIILDYLQSSHKEAMALFDMNQEEYNQFFEDLKKESTISYEKYFSIGPHINQYFIDQWNDWYVEQLKVDEEKLLGEQNNDT